MLVKAEEEEWSLWGPTQQPMADKQQDGLEDPLEGPQQAGPTALQLQAPQALP